MTTPCCDGTRVRASSCTTRICNRERKRRPNPIWNSVPAGAPLFDAQDRSYLRSGHPAGVRFCIGLEFFSARERSGDDRIKAGVTHELRSDIERSPIIARERNADSVAIAMRFLLQRLEVNGVERLHPSRTGEHRRGPPGRALRMS